MCGFADLVEVFGGEAEDVFVGGLGAEVVDELRYVEAGAQGVEEVDLKGGLRECGAGLGWWRYFGACGDFVVVDVLGWDCVEVVP